MKKLAIIIIIGLFALNTNGQSFEYRDLVELKDFSKESKCTRLTALGFKYVGQSVMTTEAISDTVAYSWVKGEEEIRFNDESIEYQWSGDSLYVQKKTEHRTNRESIHYYMFNSQVKYYRLKRKSGTFYVTKSYNENSLPNSEYTYFKRQDFYSFFYHDTQTIFVGNIVCESE
jgi:hypothetical protein